MATPREIGIGARIFVFLVYLGLGASFVATTAVLACEFWDFGWFDFVTTDSHLFLFFATLGIVALLAFYTPRAPSRTCIGTTCHSARLDSQSAYCCWGRSLI